MGQNVSFVTSVTCPTVAPAVFKAGPHLSDSAFSLLFMELELEVTVFNDDDLTRRRNSKWKKRYRRRRWGLPPRLKVTANNGWLKSRDG
ncbi:hypothetical protein F3Y22_tig00111402pilonHSYRG01083 [Hibiscus syriacus]|uniref:Uncharacterized protein n=1 Tax=Hibiscus syriacus TaxID=106335 RepID=A0A6A2XRR3_HIBSY|nr:hypothetical protein F3Y22_tig00111402pilonHSYRG01083 [Hibiscus syriacus]